MKKLNKLYNSLLSFNLFLGDLQKQASIKLFVKQDQKRFELIIDEAIELETKKGLRKELIRPDTKTQLRRGHCRSEGGNNLPS